MPVAEPIVATDVLLLLQVPPDGDELSEVELPIQVVNVPLTDDAGVATVTSRFTIHPVPNV
jgi:hypothetical protein